MIYESNHSFACHLPIKRTKIPCNYFTMRHTYSASRTSQQLFRAALHNDLGIHHASHMVGYGIGGILKSMFKRVIPLGKSLFKHGLKAAKPELRKLAAKGIDAAGSYAIKQVGSAVDRANKKVGVKRRKKDTLS